MVIRTNKEHAGAALRHGRLTAGEAVWVTRELWVTCFGGNVGVAYEWALSQGGSDARMALCKYPAIKPWSEAASADHL